MNTKKVWEQAKSLYYEEREAHKILNGWFLSRELAADAAEAFGDGHPEKRAAKELRVR